MGMIQTVLLALKDKAPQLHRQLADQGKLNQYVADVAEQIATVSVDLTQAQRLKQRWDQLGPVACAAKMKMAHALNREIAMADLLEFPQDETSLPSPDKTTSSDPTT